MSDALLRPREAAKYLALSARKVWDLTHRDGELPYIRIGRAVRYRRMDLDNWVAKQRQPATSAPVKHSKGKYRRATCSG